MNKDNFTLNFGLQKFFDFIVYHHRKKMYESIFTNLEFVADCKILDIGSTSDTGKSSNAFLHFFPKNKIISVSDQLITDETKLKFPNVEFVLGDGLSLDFPENSFDIVFSNAVLEHVGNYENVEKFILESYRVSRREVILITPNRWFPLETHTKILFLHWLPKQVFRHFLRILGMDFFSKEENLNLLTNRDLKKIILNIGIKDYEIQNLRFLGFPSNIVLKLIKEKF
jgi:ubiquinone/menaquinone biosynthesis C-methylase UbiE